MLNLTFRFDPGDHWHMTHFSRHQLHLFSISNVITDWKGIVDERFRVMNLGGDSVASSLTFGWRGSLLPADWICSQPSGNRSPMRYSAQQPERPSPGCLSSPCIRLLPLFSSVLSPMFAKELKLFIYFLFFYLNQGLHCQPGPESPSSEANLFSRLTVSMGDWGIIELLLVDSFLLQVSKTGSCKIWTQSA